MKYDQLYMDLARRVAQESKCPRKAVGCVIVAESGMLSIGFNGFGEIISGNEIKFNRSEVHPLAGDK